ncbi:MAG: hypothetical protein Q9161_001823 [Pseudevernia consocians]
MLYASNLIQWLQRKRYQYEVTFSLYMLTPTEKFIFNTFLLLFISMIIVAASLYLPEHVMKMASRAWFYYAGDETAAGVGTRAGSGAGAAGARQGDLGKAGGRMDGQDVLNMLGSL